MAGEHGDNYCYQLVHYIRRFQGMESLEALSPPKTIIINQDFAQCHGVAPFYLDDLFDIPSRSHPRYGNQGGQFTDTTERNHLAVMQVARDTKFVYFYARAREPWDGVDFDYVVDIGTGELRKSAGFPRQWEYYASIKVVNNGNNELHFSLLYQMLNIGVL
ncbi:unnamed protein product [Rotaria socialis]|uniref:Uncharacterized protein n=1 Tax=Rotaria socialis TaxID=392032 RepID=A0A821AM91_9BILA|nr:unnamed protein product [Rotaria socialis]